MSNKKIFFSVIALAALLVSCGKGDDVRGRPGDYDDPLLINTDGSALFGDNEAFKNLMSIVYDSIDEAGTTKTMILEAIEETFAKSIFGSYEKIVAAYQSGVSGAEFVALCEAYEYYSKGLDDAETKNALMFTRLTNLYDAIEERINERLLSEIQSGTYAIRNRFDEEKYATELNNRLYDVVDPISEEFPTIFYSDILLTPTVKAEDIDGFAIHKEYYTDYINRDIIPSILRSLIVENYIFDENYASLGRTYARKVNYIALQASSATVLDTNYLIDAFVNENILNETSDSPADLEILASAFRGYDFIENAESLLQSSGGFETVATTNPDLESTYYQGTAYGDIAADYEKITDNPNTTDAAIEADFTTENGNQIPKATGLQIKVDSMNKVDYTTDGWFVRNGGLTTLPEEIRTRLFSIGVSNAVDTIDDEVDAVADPKTSTYVRKVNGKYYLTPKISEPGQPADLYWFDISSQTYYLIQIEEAVSSSKLSLSNENNYTAIVGDDGEHLEAIAREVALLLSETGSYKNTALVHYLELMSIQYHDQEFYDFMKTTYPELFEDK